MILCDVNVLVYAHRRDASPDHAAYASFLEAMASGAEAFAFSESVLAGFVRVVTNPRVFRQPTPLDEALEFCDHLRRRPQAAVVRPGNRHWEIFRDLCRASSATGKLVAAAAHAALAMEHGCTWCTTDSDFARFPSLRWRHPLRPGRGTQG